MQRGTHRSRIAYAGYCQGKQELNRVNMNVLSSSSCGNQTQPNVHDEIGKATLVSKDQGRPAFHSTHQHVHMRMIHQIQAAHKRWHQAKERRILNTWKRFAACLM